MDAARKLYEDLRNVETDKDKTKEIEDELNIIIKNLPPEESKEFKRFVDNLDYFRRKYVLRSEVVESVLSIDTFDISEKKEKLALLFTYVGLVESLGNSYVDILLMLLVATGIDFHIECRHKTPRIKHAVHIRELEDELIPLGTRLNFLRENGLRVFASVVDNDLRNKIAHMDFTIRNNDVYVEDRPAISRASVEMHRLVYGCSVVGNVLLRWSKDKGVLS